jgi:hypothetical protein
MDNPEIVQVVVYDAPTSAGDSSCGCGCDHHGHGHDHSEAADPMAKVNMALQTRALALTLEAAFPGRVRVEYLNVLMDPRGQGLPQAALLCSLAYPTPLVYINGQGRFAGALPVERIREEVAKIVAPA